MANTFGINYREKKLDILFNGETHTFDLTEGDLPDYWNGFVTKDGKEWDVNFFQEDEFCEPNVSVYPAVWVGDENGSYEIDTSNEISLSLVARTGTAKEYFDSWNAPVKDGDLVGGRFKVKKVFYPASAQAEKELKEQYGEEVNLKLVKQTLDLIIQKVNDCQIGAWGGDLENTYEAVAVEDFYGEADSEEPTTKYNGWYEDLKELKKILG
jgi:hypothetical protein